jgi:hypothetical protein
VTTLTISPKAPAVGQTITLTATVSAAASAIAANPIAGTVNFYDGTTLLGSGTITTVAGVATATATAALPASTGTMVTAQSLTAVYQGNTVYASSTSVVVSVTPAAAAATIALSANVTSTISGTSVVLTATVSGLTASGVSPTGTVSFYLAGAKPTLIGAATLGTTGSGISTAVFATANLPNGVLTIYATYGGDSNFGTATSGDITVGISDYVVSFVPQTLTIAQGMTGSTTAVATAVNGFSGNIIFGCTPPPNTYVTCSFNPEVISGSGTSKLTVATTAGTDGVGLIVRGGGAALGTLLLCWLVPSRRRRMARLLLGLMALGLAMNLGCSGNDFNAAAANAAGGTPLGTMLLQINSAGTNGSGTIRHNFTFQVTVVGQ